VTRRSYILLGVSASSPVPRSDPALIGADPALGVVGSEGVADPVTPKGRRTREQLLKAGSTVAEREGLAGLSIASVTAEAGVAKGTFYVHFADREGFVDALHQRFYARVSEAVTRAVSDLAPGVERLLVGIETYLDTCLEHHAIKALILESRTGGNLTTTVEQREELFARLAEPSLAAMGLGDPGIAARLFVAMTSEAALIELQAGRRVAGVRDTIRELAQNPPEAQR
jgi:TetR/AcrR family transcriptional repressor of nem operon